MSRKFKLATCLSLGVLLLSTVVSSAAQAKKHKHTYSPGNVLVPPPPAYMPSILPELQASSNSSKNQPKPANPYKKYVYAAQGYEDPTPVKTHHTVTYWNKKPD